MALVAIRATVSGWIVARLDKNHEEEWVKIFDSVVLGVITTNGSLNDLTSDELSITATYNNEVRTAKLTVNIVPTRGAAPSLSAAQYISTIDRHAPIGQFCVENIEEFVCLSTLSIWYWSAQTYIKFKIRRYVMNFFLVDLYIATISLIWELVNIYS